MEHMVKKVMVMGVEQFMDKSRQKICMSDTTYLKDNEDERELEQRYMELNLTRRQRQLVNDYIACMQTVQNRYADISYLAGVKDTMKILDQLGIFKSRGLLRIQKPR